MTGDEYEEEIAQLRKSAEHFKVTVIEALNRAISRLDRENAQLQAKIDELERELRIVNRDREALIRRADTAEKTLLNSGFNLHTMQREERRNSGSVVGPLGTIGSPGYIGRGFEREGGSTP